MPVCSPRDSGGLGPTVHVPGQGVVSASEPRLRPKAAGHEVTACFCGAAVRRQELMLLEPTRLRQPTRGGHAGI